jgi:hypothetical protein
MSCDVCDGNPGRYPIYNNKGRVVFEIECPACGGTAMSREEWAAHLDAVSDRMRYADAMREQRP